MPQTKKTDAFDDAPEIGNIFQSSPEGQKEAQTPAPVSPWETPQFQKAFPGTAMAMHQMAQMPGAIENMITGIPNAVKHPMDTLSSMFTGPASVIGTAVRGAGALVGQLPMVSGGQPIAPNIQAPSQPEWESAVQGATQMGVSAALPEAIRTGIGGVANAVGSAGSAAESGIVPALGNMAKYGVVRGGLKTLYDRATATPEAQAPAPPPNGGGSQIVTKGAGTKTSAGSLPKGSQIVGKQTVPAPQAPPVNPTVGGQFSTTTTTAVPGAAAPTTIDLGTGTIHTVRDATTGKFRGLTPEEAGKLKSQPQATPQPQTSANPPAPTEPPKPRVKGATNVK